MQAKLLRIKLNPNSRARLDNLLEYMQSNPEFPRQEMEQKGYYWDSAFFEKVNNVEFLYLVIKSPDFSKIMMDESQLIATPFRDLYDAFRQSSWAPEPYEDLELLTCFNSEMKYV